MTSPSIRVVVFDAYGTLFDVYSIGALAEKLDPGQGAALSVLWRDKPIEYTRLISLSDPNPKGSRYYQSFWELTRASLRYALGATWFGFTTLWVNRQGLPPQAIEPAPHHTGRDLTAVLQVLG